MSYTTVHLSYMLWTMKFYHTITSTFCLLLVWKDSPCLCFIVSDLHHAEECSHVQVYAEPIQGFIYGGAWLPLYSPWSSFVIPRHPMNCWKKLDSHPLPLTIELLEKDSHPLFLKTKILPSMLKWNPAIYNHQLYINNSFTCVYTATRQKQSQHCWRLGLMSTLL